MTPFPTHAFICCAAALLMSVATSQAGKLIPLPQMPDSIETDIGGINNSNVITGSYAFVFGGQTYQNGFFGTLDGQYTSFFRQDRDVTNGVAINDDGYVSGLSYSYEDGSYCGNGLIRSPDGTISDVTRGGEVFDGIALGITDKQLFVGRSCEFGTGLVYHGYLGKGTRYKSDIVLPFNTDRPSPAGINRKGTIVGSFKDKDLQNRYRGFLLSGDMVTAFDYPDAGASYTFFDAINDKGLVAGNWYDVDFNSHPFLFDSQRQTFKAITVKGAISAGVAGINNAGLVTIEADRMPYIYCSKKKTCPPSPRAVDIDDRWLPVPEHALHKALCRNHCLVPRQ